MELTQHLYHFLKIIPKGKIVSYGFLGKIFLSSPREIARLLSENTQQGQYPCYKVISSNGEISGYNLGVEEKIKRLNSDGIILENGKIAESYFRNPKIRNFFVAFPMEGEQLTKFVHDINIIKSKTEFYRAIRFQNILSPHINLHFFGNIDLEQYNDYVQKTLNILENIDFNLKNQEIILDNFDNFNKRVAYFGIKDEKVTNEIIQFKNSYLRLLGIDQRRFYPHMTFYRAKDRYNPAILSQINNYAKEFAYKMKLEKFRFYAAFDEHFQVPLVDLRL